MALMLEKPVFRGTLTDEVLWYSRPASEWMEGLPIGTGRLAGMVMGGVRRERIALNHEWLWKGRHRNRDNEVRSHLLPEVRRLLLAGQYEEGTRLANEAFGGLGGMSGKPHRVDPYQPAGDLYLEFGHDFFWDYQRSLDLTTAQVTVDYHANWRLYKREIVAHLVEDLILIRLTSAGLPFNLTVSLDRTMDPDCRLVFAGTPDSLAMDGHIDQGIDFRVQVATRHDGGTVAVRDRRFLDCVQVKELILAVNIGTSAKKKSAVEECGPVRVPDAAWDDLMEAHRREHRRHYGGMSLKVPVPVPTEPTDRRIEAFRRGDSDPALPLLYFHYGRYLLCASTAKADLPPNLQGKWNEDLNPPWEADLHQDVNLQMNYWPAEAGALQAYTNALFTHMENFVAHGRKAARDLYGCDGIWFPIQTDPWGRSTPEAFGWAVWIGAAPWLAQHMWWHYEYGQDVEFLRNRAYPFFKEVAAFYESYLVKDAAGTWQIVPSQSPENRFKGTGDKYPVSIGVSATMDVLLAMDLLSHAVRAAEILGVDADRQSRWREILAHLPPLKIGKHGQLQEWNEDFEEIEPGHRHISHLFGLYPGDQLTPDRTPDLFQAARVSLERRLANFGGHTGWSRSWVACCYARLGDAPKAYEQLCGLIADFACGSLMDLHPPRIFQIDGNFGGTAAVLEMLLQSYHEELDFLPALPLCWPEGEVAGIRGRGGYTIRMKWSGGQLREAEVAAVTDRECRVVERGRVFRVMTPEGKEIAATSDGRCWSFKVGAGKAYRLVFQS
jgi:alpha-L-fucosidase 2